MYCKKCYTPLTSAPELGGCPKCGRAFRSDDPKTYLLRPFPSRSMMVWQISATTVVGIIGAFVVATFQAAGASGH